MSCPQTKRSPLLTVLGMLVFWGLLATPVLGEFIEMDPDNSEWFAENGVVDGHGVMIRGWSDTPPSPLSVWDQPYQKLYARDPLKDGTPYLGVTPSTGRLVFGIWGATNLYASTRLGGSDQHCVHMLFDNPTNYVGFDILWPDAAWTEGVRFDAWTKDYNGTESVVYGKVYNEGLAGTYTRVSLFHPGITRIRLYGHDKYGFKQRYFGLDNLTFVSTASVSAFTLGDGETIVAPEGLLLNAGDSLKGTGTVDGSLTVTSGTVRPGLSPGQIVVTGNYTQDAASVLEMEIADNGHDQLVIDALATLGGTLDLSLLSGFAPENGQSFTLLTYGDYQGEFDQILGLDFEGGYFDPTYEPNSFVVTAVVPEPTTLGLLALGGLALIRRRRMA